MKIDKNNVWVKSDLRLIFTLDGSMMADEAIEKLNVIVKNPTVTVFA